MRRSAFIVSAAFTVAALTLPAAAQTNLRSWVASTGSDAADCSRATPCRNIGGVNGAIGKTVAGGEVNCVDAADYGAGILIQKSITIDCTNVLGGVQATAALAGVVVQATLSDRVTLRGLDIQGSSSSSDGVRVSTVGIMHIDRCIIRGFASFPGISFDPSNAGARLFLTDSAISENGSSGTQAGLRVKPFAAGTANVVIDNVNFKANNFGMFFDGAGGSGIRAVVKGGMSSGNTVNGIGISSNGPPVLVFVDGVTIFGNANGIAAGGAGAVGLVSNSIIAGHTSQGVSVGASAIVVSYGDNKVGGNAGGDGAFSGGFATK
jgi:hypothetical protein